MKNNYFSLWFPILFICGFSGFSQTFAPSLWLSNPQKTNDTLAEFDRLNFHRDLGLQKNNLWRSSKKINQSQHLFLVYKSRKNENIVSLIGKKSAVFLDGKHLFVNDSVDTNGYNEPYGELLDMQFANIEDGRFWMNSGLKDSRVFELVLTDQNTTTPINEIRTYLSLKYGVDLIDYKQYTYKDQQLWDGSDKKYNNYIFGVAQMGAFNLTPSKSVHSKDRDLIVSVSRQQAKRFEEGTFLLLGSNGARFSFDPKTKRTYKQWMAQTNKNFMLADLSIPLSKLDLSENNTDEYELLVGSKTGTTERYRAVITDTLAVFRNVVFQKDHNSIVQLQKSPSQIRFETETDCDQLRLKIDTPDKINGFRLDITDDTGKKIYSTTAPKKEYTVDTGTAAYLDITLQYNYKTISKRIPTLAGSMQAADLKKTYTLNEGALEIKLENPQQLTYQWYSGTVLTGTGNTVRIDREGNYTLKVSNGASCAFTQHFNVMKALQNEQWRVFPNPATVSEDVQVAFELEEEAPVTLAIYQSDGKLIKTINAGVLQNKTINLGHFTTSSGTYMVVAYINDIPQIKKIIIEQ